MVIKDYYKILGFDTNRVSIDEIKVAYRELAKKYHPDVNNNNLEAEEKFKDIGEAYNTLSNTRQRRKYDRMWIYYIGRYNKQNAKYKKAKIKDFMGLFFGEIKEEKNIDRDEKESRRGEDIYTEITVTLTEAFFGAIKQLNFKTIDGGTKKIEAKIPSGIRNKERIRLIGQGKPGKNGGKNGDLFVKINIKDMSNLKLEGIDLCTDLLISPWESALGSKAVINNIDEEIKIDIPNGIQSGEKIVLKDKGYKNGKGGRGNLIINVKIMMPKNISNEEIALFKKLKEISKFNPRKAKTI